MPCGWEDNCTSCIILTMCHRLQSLTGWRPKKGRWAPRLHSSWGMAHFTFLGAYCLPNWCLFLTFGVIFWTCLQTVIEVTQVLVISLVKFWSQSWQIPSKPQDVKSICCSLTGMSPSLKLCGTFNLSNIPGLPRWWSLHRTVSISTLTAVGLFCCWPDGLELSPRLYLGPAQTVSGNQDTGVYWKCTW